MNNRCKIDFINREICVTKSYYRTAQCPGTEEFETLVQLQAKLPDYRIVIQEPLRSKQCWYPTYAQMMDYIRVKNDNVENELSKLQEIIVFARAVGRGYNMVRRWFMQQYGEDNMNYLQCLAD